MTIACWQLYEALWRGAARFREDTSPDPAGDAPIEAAFRGLIAARVTRPRGLHAEEWVAETLIPLLDRGSPVVGERELRALEGWPLAAVVYARELKRVAATLGGDPVELSSEGLRWLVSVVIDGVLRDHAPWAEALVEPLAPPDVADPPTRHLLIREGAARLARLEIWEALDSQGPGWQTRAWSIAGDELLTGYLRQPRHPGGLRDRSLRPGERELLADIAAHPDDDGPREVYADWLTVRGDPRGELILLQVMRGRGETGDDRAAREASLRGLHGPAWTGLDPAWQLAWRAGFVEEARFAATGDAAAEDHAMWSFLDRADVGVLRRLAVTCSRYVAPLLEVLPRARWSNLEELAIEWRSPNRWDRFQLTAAEVQRLCANTPRLRRLALTGDRLLPELAHPHLEELRVDGLPAIAACGIEHPQWRGEGVQLPRLTSLALAFRDDVTTDQLVLDPARVPMLRHLTLGRVLAGATTPLAWIAHWPGAARLATVRVAQLDHADEPHLAEIAARLRGASRIEVERLEGSVSFRGRVRELLPQLRVG